MNDKVVRIELGDGKYTYVHDPVTGRQEALRYGQEWRDLVGDNLVYLLAQEVLEAQAKAKAFDMLSSKLSFVQEWMSEGKISSRYLGMYTPDVVRELLESFLLDQQPSAVAKAQYLVKRLDLGEGEVPFIAAHINHVVETETEELRESQHILSVAIGYALEAEDGMDWLRLWNEGDYHAARKGWPDSPNNVYPKEPK